MSCIDCPANVPMVTCDGDPCDNAFCPGYPDATCIPDYCGHCRATWYIGDERVYCTGQLQSVDDNANNRI